MFKSKRLKSLTRPSNSSLDESQSSGDSMDAETAASEAKPYVEPEAVPLKRLQSHATTVYVDAYDGNSPYAEVRASVPNYDEESLPQNTVRMWVIGIILMSAATGMNAVFYLHNPPFIISPYLIIVLAWPVGWIWERVVPNIWGLNPGPFTYKEHALISILASASSMTVTGDTVITLIYFYQTEALGSNIMFVILLNWGSTLAGMAIAGPLVRVLVDPPSMVWPTELVTVTLLSNIHVKWNHVANGWRITRKKFFLIATFVCAGYSILVRIFFGFLSRFAFAAWISPDNYVINQLFGAVSGAGIFPITFDWNIVSGFLASPLVPPARVFANTGMAIVCIVWISATAIHYSNRWWGRYLPFADPRIFDRYGQTYDVAKVTNGLKLDLNKYHEYSPIFMATTRIINFGLGLAGSMAILVHTILNDGPRLASYFRQKPEDVHSLLMRKYNTVPIWWYGFTFIAAVGVIYASLYGFESGVPGWYPVISLLMVVVWIIPVAVVCASTTVTIDLSSLVLLLTGYMDPGNAMGMMTFKNWTVSSLDAGVQYLSIVKLGQYTKLRPKLVFIVRLVGLLWSGALQIIILVKVRPYVARECQNIRDPAVACAAAHKFFTESISWGIVGSKHIMRQYGPVLHLLWIGALLPVLSWLWLKKWPRSPMRVLHWPIFFHAINHVPPATPYNYTCWVVVGLIFSHWIRRYWHSWWAKYCYTLSAALDFGLAVMELVVFFIYLGTDKVVVKWWGTSGYRNNIDARSEPMVKLKPGDAFGPSKW